MKAAVRKAATPRRHTTPQRRLVTQHPRRRVLSLAAGAAALPAVSRFAWAQAYPTRPITMIVPIAAGSAADVVGRLVAERMGTALGQPIIIENVPGADGSIGVGRVARARPDGYTIESGFQSANVLNGAFYSLSYDLLGDLTPISPLAAVPVVLYARASLPAKDLKELIALLRANPNKVSAGVAASSYRMVMALFQKETGTRFTLVPYRGFPPEMQDLVAGRIDFVFESPAQLPLMRARNIKVYAVTSDARLAQAPDIPTFSEMGLPSVSYSGWQALFAPKGVPKDIIGKLNAAAAEALADEIVRSRLIDLGFEVYPRERQTPEALNALRKAHAERWWPIIKELGIKPQ
jgi:tripartite-type tricarboxylate transporter receptor subunit TctC